MREITRSVKAVIIAVILDHALPSYSVFVWRYVTWPCDLDLWPFELEQLTYMAGCVNNLASQFEDPMPIRSWVVSYNVSRWLSLKMRTRPLRMRRITYWTLNVEHTVAFTAIFNNICTAHAQKRLSMNFRCKFKHCHWIPRPQLPIWVQNVGDLATFSVDFFAFYMLNVLHISTSDLFDPLP